MGSKVNILLIEDDENDVFFFRRCLGAAATDAGVRVVENAWDARNYLEGLGKFSDRTYYPIPDLIVADLNLPGASGLEFLQWKRVDERFKGIPIVILSGAIRGQDCAAIQEAGALAQFLKTPNFQQAQSNVRKILDCVGPRP
jgi:two-component system, chemotaxis family, response regulator Rcp1